MSTSPEQAIRAVEDAIVTYLADKPPDALTPFERAVVAAVQAWRRSA